MKLKINWEHKRAKHAIERMWLKGISVGEVRNAIIKGQKRKQKNTKLMESFYSYYSVVYEEFIYEKQNIRKIYPITIKIW